MNRHPGFVRITGLLLTMLMVGSGFLGALGLLFHGHGDRAPALIEDNFRGGLVVCLLSLIAIIAFLRSQPGNQWVAPAPDLFGFRRRRSAREARSLTRDCRLRLQRLARDPATRKYAVLISQDEQWTDEQIAYERNPDMVMSCVHLQPVEQAMRRAGIHIRPVPFTENKLDARCCIDMPALERQFGVAPCVIYATVAGDRQYDPENVSLYCKEHGSSIALVNPDEAKPDMRCFPE